MGEQTGRKGMTMYAMLDEEALRITLARIEEMRDSPDTAGLDLCYGAVVSLEITAEDIESDAPTMQRCRIRAGGWSADLPPRMQTQKGGLQA